MAHTYYLDLTDNPGCWEIFYTRGQGKRESAGMAWPEVKSVSRPGEGKKDVLNLAMYIDGDYRTDFLPSKRVRLEFSPKVKQYLEAHANLPIMVENAGLTLISLSYYGKLEGNTLIMFKE